MNEQLPYEHEIIQKLEALSLPDENTAWIDMRRRLDEEDNDDGIIIPPLKGCGLFLIIAIGLLLIGSLLFHNKIFKHQNISEKNYAGKQIQKQKSLNKKSGSNVIITDSSIKHNNTVNTDKDKNAANIDTLKTNQQAAEKKIVSSKQYQHLPADKRHNVTDNKINIEEEKGKSISGKHADKGNIDTSANNQNSFDQSDSLNSINNTKDSINHQTDTASKKISTQTKKDSSVNNNKEQKEKSHERHKNSFTAGFTEHQQIPFGGQTFIPFKVEGFGGLLLNYIPSIFYKLHFKQKVFVQLEFRYRAPQLTKDFFIRSNVLKKIYYHQLPLSIHYNLTPRLSAGTGIIFNKFSSSVEKNIGADSTTKYLKIKRDSAFKPIYLQGMFETEYKWKKFSFGFIYEQGLQPFLRREYSLNPSQNKNPSLQIFLRYELWRSKKK